MDSPFISVPSQQDHTSPSARMSLWTRPRTNICYLNRLIKLRCSCHYRTGSSIISCLRAGRTTTIAMATRLPGRGAGHTGVSAPQRGSLQPHQDPEISSSSSPWAAPVHTPAPTSYCPCHLLCSPSNFFNKQSISTIPPHPSTCHQLPGNRSSRVLLRRPFC